MSDNLPRLSNFRLYEPQHNGRLVFSRDFDTDESVESWLHDDANMVNINYQLSVSVNGDETVLNANQPAGHPNNPNDKDLLYFGYRTVFEVDTKLTCVYIGNLNITGAEMFVIDTFGNLVQSTKQVDDFLYAELPPSFLSRRYDVFITFPKEGAFDASGMVRVSMTPPFFGGAEISEDTCTCYSWGRGYEFNDQSQYQTTRTQRYKQQSNAFESKTLTIEGMNSHQSNNLISFLERNEDRTTLLREYSDTSRHNFILGKATGSSGSQAQADLNTVQLNSQAKFLNRAKAL